MSKNDNHIKIKYLPKKSHLKSDKRLFYISLMTQNLTLIEANAQQKAQTKCKALAPFNTNTAHQQQHCYHKTLFFSDTQQQWKEQATMNAEAIIGKQQDDDYILAPHTHADALPDEAKSLKAILKRSDTSVLQDQYRRFDEKAIDAQSQYKTASKRKIYASALAIIIAALILYLQTDTQLKTILDSHDRLKNALFITLGIIELAAIFIVTYYTNLLRNSDIYERWMEQRSLAETCRLNYFDKVTNAPKQGDSSSLAALQFAYYCRYMLGVQLNFYKHRGKQHAQKAKQILSKGSLLAALVIVIPAITQKLSINLEQITVLIAFIGAIITALTTMHSQLSAIDEDLRNARRYELNYEKLLTLSGERDNVKKAISEGKRERMEQFIQDVNEIISVEHREWKKWQNKQVSHSETA